MAAGRCAGCGRQGSARRISHHTTECAPWLELFEADPSRALSPEAEYQRWQREGRQEERDAHLAAVTSEARVRRSAAADRFRRRDILAD